MNTTKTIRKPLLWLGILITIGSSGCASNKTAKNPNDPWESWNRNTASFNDDVDKAILKPMATEYKTITPAPIDQGVTNFFSNINDIGVSINALLQLKFLQSGMDLSRFIVNSTAGVAGFFDIASKIDLPKHNEDFGQTLGVWGVPSGPYLVLPFLGASSPRDAAGLLGDALLNPLTYVSLFGGVAANAATTGSTVLDVTDSRSDLMSTEKIVNEGAVNRYDFIKNAYQQHREYLIYDGNPPEDKDDLLEGDNGLEPHTNATATSPPTGLSNKSGGAPVIDNSKTLPAENIQPVPIINNSKRFLELSAPD